MAGEFMQEMDSIVVGIRRLILLAGVVIFCTFILFPYIVYRYMADTMSCAFTRDRVWIVEVNSEVYPNVPLNQGVPSPFPLIDGIRTKCPVRHYYACVHSVKDAENWLLEHNYKQVNKKTRMFGEYTDRDVSVFSHHIPNTKAYSYACLLIDYGDYDIYVWPFSFPPVSSFVNLDRFKYEDYHEVGGTEKHNEKYSDPPLLFCYTYGKCNWLDGCRLMENRDELLSYRTGEYKRDNYYLDEVLDRKKTSNDNKYN